MKKYCFVLLAVMIALCMVGCGGGGGGSSVTGVLTAPGAGTVTGSVSNSSVSGSLRASFELKNPAADQGVEIGHYNVSGIFVGLKSGKTNANGEYTFTDVRNDIKNMIIRAPALGFECVLPEVVKDGTVKAPMMDPDSGVTAMIVREAAMQKMSDKLNMAEVLSKIPPTTLHGLKNKPDEIAKIAKAFSDREKALDTAAGQIGQNKLNELRSLVLSSHAKLPKV